MMQFLRYCALALVSVCLILIALVISGLVPLDSVRRVMAKVPEMVRVTATAPVEQDKDAASVAVSNVATSQNEEDTSSAEVADQAGGQSDGSSDVAVVDQQSSTTDGADADTDTDADAAATDLPKDGDAKTEGGEVAATDVADSADSSGDATRLPRFDVLRVEQDGSIVVAGNAAPNSRVELRRGDGTIVGSTTANATGDFVIVPDAPITAGDHSLGLVVVGPNGSETASTELATVSVPKDGQGDVLAMVSEPGKPSRIISKPDTLATPDGDADQEDVAALTDQDASGGDAGKNQTSADATDTGNGDTASSGAATETSATNDKENATDSAASAGNSEPNSNAAEGDTGDQQVAAVDSDDAGDGSGASNVEAEEAAAAEEPRVRVEAVEVEADQIFIAGEASKGSVVRVYIDEQLVGEARGTSDNRFLVTQKFKLSPGQHRVRADTIDSATGKVIARAEVPLLHEPVEVADGSSSDASQLPENQDATTDQDNKPDVASVETDGDSATSKQAPQTTAQTAGQDEAAAPTSVAQADDGTKSTQDKTQPEQNAEGGSQTASNQPATQAQSDNQASGNEVVVEGENAQETSETVQTAASETSESATRSADASNKGTSASEEETSSAGTDVAALGDDEDAQDNQSQQSVSSRLSEGSEGTLSEAGSANAGAQKKTETNAQSQNTTTAQNQGTSPDQGTDSSATEVAVSEPISGDSETALSRQTEQPPGDLIRTGSSVIIKPGDSLWRISRRTYGRGIRYTTIYEANRDQIRNPHRIYIGQIFRIPDRPDEERVEADG